MASLFRIALDPIGDEAADRVRARPDLMPRAPFVERLNIAWRHDDLNAGVFLLHAKNLHNLLDQRKCVSYTTSTATEDDMANQINIEIGDALSVVLDGALTSGGALCCLGFSGDVIETTEKAVKLCGTTESGKEITAWFPRKAFSKPMDRGTFGNQRVVGAALARWFNPTGWTAKFMSLTTQNSTLVAR